MKPRYLILVAAGVVLALIGVIVVVSLGSGVRRSAWPAHVQPLGAPPPPPAADAAAD